MHLRFLLVFLVMFFSSYAIAAEKIDAEDVIILPLGQTHHGDYFAWGKSIEISGTVEGDLYVFAEQIIVDGVVRGDVLACGGSIDISGDVAHNVRALAGQVLINGHVGSNITAVAGNFQIQPSAVVGGSVVVIAGNADLAAKIGCEVTAISSNLRISSIVSKGLKAYVGHMRITSRARIGGDVDYRSNASAWIDPGALIEGELIHHPSFVHELLKGTWIQKVLFGSKVLGLIMNFFYTFVVGVILLKLFPKNAHAALFSLREKPLKAFCYGSVLLIALPLVSIILLMTILGIPFAITLIAANIISLYTAKIYTILWASNWALGRYLKPNRLPLLFLGLLAYFCLSLIPVFGTLLAVLAMLFGLGAGVMAQASAVSKR